MLEKNNEYLKCGCGREEDLIEKKIYKEGQKRMKTIYYCPDCKNQQGGNKRVYWTAPLRNSNTWQPFGEAKARIIDRQEEEEITSRWEHDCPTNKRKVSLPLADNFCYECGEHHE